MNMMIVASADKSFLTGASFWEGLWWVGVGLIALWVLITARAQGLASSLGVGVAMLIAWVPVFAILWFFGSVLGIISEVFVADYGG